MTNQGRGLRSPCTPRQGYHPCTRSATHNWIEQGCFRMMGEETKNSTTGTMKTKKERVREFSHRFFLSFSPDAIHPVGGILPPARVCQWHFQFAKLQSFFAKGFLRVSWRGDANPSGPTGQLSLQ